MFDGFELLYSDEEECVLLVLRSEDRHVFRAYHDGEKWVGDRVDLVLDDEEGDYWELHEPKETIEL